MCPSAVWCSSTVLRCCGSGTEWTHSSRADGTAPSMDAVWGKERGEGKKANKERQTVNIQYVSMLS